MTLSVLTVVFDADDPQLVGRFWAAALDRELTEGDPREWASLPGDPRIDFMKVPEARPRKTGCIWIGARPTARPRCNVCSGLARHVFGT